MKQGQFPEAIMLLKRLVKAIKMIFFHTLLK